MVTQDFTIYYDVKPLAKKDPFDLEEMSKNKKMSIEERYTGITSDFIRKTIMESDSFSQLFACAGSVRTYFFDKGSGKKANAYPRYDSSREDFGTIRVEL
jgi:hypothetical protein